MSRIIFPISPLIFSLLLILITSCNGQNKVENPDKNTSNLIGKIVDKLDDKANLIYQDKKNNYWFANKDVGIYKYDGKSLVMYTFVDGLVSHSVLSIQEDKLGNLYFDTPEGVSKFDGQKFTTLIPVETTSPSDKSPSSPEDLWFRIGWDNDGPFRYDGKKLIQLKFPKNKEETVFKSKYPNVTYDPYGIYSHFKDSKGNQWFGTSSLGIYRFDGQKWAWMYENHLTDTPEGGSFGIRSIMEDKDGYFWICNSSFRYKILVDSSQMDGLQEIKYTREIGIENKDNPATYFLSMTKDKVGNLWMVTYDDGVYKNTGKELIHFPIKEGEKNILLASIYTDNQGNIWVGTQENGSYKFNGKSFEKFTGI